MCGAVRETEGLDRAVGAGVDSHRLGSCPTRTMDEDNEDGV